MKKQTAIRQGDVLIVPCNVIPADAKPVQAEAGRLIVARGEATGHHHSFPLGPQIAMFRDDGAGGALYLKASETVSLEHQEHSALTIPKGTYRVLNQRVAVSGLVRRVVD